MKKKLDTKELEELGKVIKTQRVIDEIVVKNSDSIKLLDEEIKSIFIDKHAKEEERREIDDAIKLLNKEILSMKKEHAEDKLREELPSVSKSTTKKDIKCRYNNSGYCKYKFECKFIHTNNVCNNYLGGKCEDKRCPDRHPKACKWFKGETGCRRKEGCEYSHDTLVCDDGKKIKSKVFKCVGCKHDWNEEKFVVKYNINETELYFAQSSTTGLKGHGVGSRVVFI